MEILKDYEVRQVGSQFVLFMMSASKFEMKSIIVADEVVENKGDFFVLRTGNKLVLCWEKKSLRIVSACQEYRFFKEDVVLYKKDDKWFFWENTDAVQKTNMLGIQVFPIGPAFISECRTGMCFVYPEKDEFKSISCIGYALLCKQEINPNSFLDEELFADVLRLDTKEGPLFVSIKKKTGQAFHHMRGTTRGKVSYQFVFSREASEKVVKFTNFVNETLQKLCDMGFVIPVNGGCREFYTTAQINELMKKNKDVLVTVHVGLSQTLAHNLEVKVNLSKLYRNEQGAYQVNCPVLNYFETVNDVQIEQNSSDKALRLTSERATERIFIKNGENLTLGGKYVMS